MWIVRPPIAAMCPFVEARLVERVGVDLHLHVEFVGGVERRVDDGGRRAPVLVDLQTDRAGADLFEQAAQRRTPTPSRGSRN